MRMAKSIANERISYKVIPHSLPKSNSGKTSRVWEIGNGLVEAKTVRWTVFSESRSSYAAHAPVQALPKLV